MKRKLKLFVLIFLIIAFIIFIIQYLIYPFTYTNNTAMKNGDVIVGAGGGNEEKFYQFIDNINKGNQTKLRITAYGKEGEPTIMDIDFNGSIIYYRADATRRFLGKHRYKESGEYTSIKSEKHNGIIDYYLFDKTGKYKDVWIFQE